MPRNVLRFEGRPLLDIASYARRGPGAGASMTATQIEQIRRTVHRTPEVMVKVLTRGATSLKAVQGHFSYLSRSGRLEIDTDDGERLGGKGTAQALLQDWDLEIDQHRQRSELRAGTRRTAPRLVHKLLFSMPPGTPPKKVLEAVKNFAREEFGLQHRYAMVLHTDEPHPHVHLVVKAISEQGVRLNIKKPTLRRWRAEFAAHLRQLGVPANATERAVRGENRSPLRDPIFRTGQRGESRHLNRRLESDAVASQGMTSGRGVQATRERVRRGWRQIEADLRAAGQISLAAQVSVFARSIPEARGSDELTVDERLHRLPKRITDREITK